MPFGVWRLDSNQDLPLLSEGVITNYTTLEFSYENLAESTFRALCETRTRHTCLEGRNVTTTPIGLIQDTFFAFPALPIELQVTFQRPDRTRTCNTGFIRPCFNIAVRIYRAPCRIRTGDLLHGKETCYHYTNGT